MNTKLLILVEGTVIFAEEMQKYSVHPVIIIKPAPHLAEMSREKGFEVIEKFLEDVLLMIYQQT